MSCTTIAALSEATESDQEHAGSDSVLQTAKRSAAAWESLADAATHGDKPTHSYGHVLCHRIRLENPGYSSLSSSIVRLQSLQQSTRTDGIVCNGRGTR